MNSSLCTLTKVHIDNKHHIAIHNNNHRQSNHANGSSISTTNNNNNNFNNNTLNHKKPLLSPKLTPYLTTFKSNISEFNKHKPKYHYNTKHSSIKQYPTNPHTQTTLTHIHTHTQPLSNTSTRCYKNQTFYTNDKHNPRINPNTSINTTTKPSSAYKKNYITTVLTQSNSNITTTPTHQHFV